MERQRGIVTGLTVVVALMSQPVARAATPVGEVEYARGVLTGQVESSSPRILGQGNPLHNGETLNTGSSGFALIKLDDGSKLTLRPNTTFKIEDVSVQQGRENALLSLFRGGFRAITGFISKRRPDSFRVNTSVATIGIRGTQFDARICEGGECEAENQATGKVSKRQKQVIGRVAVMNGSASAVGNDDQARTLSVGAPVYEQDQVATGIKSFAVVAFNDESRITLSPESVFVIEEHRFDPAQAERNNAFLRFVRGGMRLVTGLIGQFNRESYRVGTPTATIGIRGTGFDLACDGECIDNTASFNPYRQTFVSRLLHYFVKPVLAAEGDGMYARVWSGAIEFQFQGGTMLLENGRVAFMKNGFTNPVVVPDMPVYLRSMGNAPRPDRIAVPDNLFSGSEDQEIQPGLYVNVRDGQVDLEGQDGQTVSLGADQAGKVGLDGKSVKLNFIPPFQQFDNVPLPSRLTPEMQKLIALFGEAGTEKEEFECRLQ